MLVLRRKKGQKITIGGNVVVTVLEIGGHVQIGAEAPRSVPVRRRELLAEADALRIDAAARGGHAGD